MMPLTGYILANVFKRPLYYFSPHECFTFLPDASPLNLNSAVATTPLGPRSHFVSVTLKSESSVLVIALRWKRYTSSSSVLWQHPLSHKIIMYEELRKPSRPKLTEEEIHAATITLDYDMYVSQIFQSFVMHQLLLLCHMNLCSYYNMIHLMQLTIGYILCSKT